MPKCRLTAVASSRGGISPLDRVGPPPCGHDSLRRNFCPSSCLLVVLSARGLFNSWSRQPAVPWTRWASAHPQLPVTRPVPLQPVTYPLLLSSPPPPSSLGPPLLLRPLTAPPSYSFTVTSPARVSVLRVAAGAGSCDRHSLVRGGEAAGVATLHAMYWG